MSTKTIIKKKYDQEYASEIIAKLLISNLLNEMKDIATTDRKGSLRDYKEWKEMIDTKTEDLIEKYLDKCDEIKLMNITEHINKEVRLMDEILEIEAELRYRESTRPKRCWDVTLWSWGTNKLKVKLAELKFIQKKIYGD